MGYFRKHKKKDYTLEQAKRNCRKALEDMLEAVRDGGVVTVYTLETYAEEWAEWRELQARLEGDNKSDVH